MKRLAFCFDGTWQKLSQPSPTNVALTAECVLSFVEGDVGQVVFYDEGIGSGAAIQQHVLGGVFGDGMMDVMADAYRFLIFNYQKGDELYVFGFSRGAFTARSFVGLLSTCGILDQRCASMSADIISKYEAREDTKAWRDEMRAYRAKNCTRVVISADEEAWRQQQDPNYVIGSAKLLEIKYVGVWETVGALGVPSWMVISGWFDQKYKFHDTNLTTLVNSARHAVAIDEERLDYTPTLWTNIDDLNNVRKIASNDPKAPNQQKWFPGGHGAVGGGGDRRGLSDAALEWIWEGAAAAGLRFDTSAGSRMYDLSPNALEWLDNSSTPPDLSIGQALNDLEIRRPRKGPDRIDDVGVSARRRWQAPSNMLHENELYRPATLASLKADLDALPPVDWTDAADNSEPFIVYIVKEGDDLTKLAEAFYHDASQYMRIYKANLSVLTDPDQIYVGQSLRIPGIKAH